MNNSYISSKIKLKKQQAFSLVELSIVIVIISLIIAASIAGKDLLRSTEVKVIIAESADFKAALSQFEASYNYLPGDMENASDYWTGANDGNGDGEILGNTESVNATAHLALADFLKGNYTGTFGGSGYELGTGGNTYESKIGVEGNAVRVACCSDSDDPRDIDFNNFINFFTKSSANRRRAGAMSPIEAYNIDKKIDDSFPDSGFIAAQGIWNGTDYDPAGCYTDSGNNDKGIYLAADDTVKNEKRNCQLFFAYDWD